MVEAAEYKRSAVLRKVRHISGIGLIGLVFKIHQLMLNHKVDEFAGFGTEIVVHFLCFGNHILFVADGLRVAVGEYKFFIVSHNMINTDAFCLRFVKLFAKGNKLTANLLAEGSNLLLTVIASSLLKIAQGSKGLVAQRLTHFGTNFYKLVEDFFHLLLVAFIKLGVFFECCLANFAVRVLKVLLNAVKVKLLSVKLNLCGSHQLLILGFKTAFLLHKRNKSVIILSKLAAGGNKVFLAEIRINFSGETAIDYCFGKGDERTLRFGGTLMNEFDFFLVEFIGGVKSIADMRNGGHGVKLGHILVGLKNDGFYVGVAFRRFNALGKLFCFGFCGVKIRSYIFQIAESKIFHMIFFLS